MPIGVWTAFEEITLVVFTTFAPSGMVACAIMGLAIAIKGFGKAERVRVEHMLALPLAVSMAGLVASATHLGNPSNALYVIMGVGRSPLSNEVVSTVVFLISAGATWLFSFVEKDMPRTMKALGFLTAFSACVALAFLSLAYDVRTVITWGNPLVPASLVSGAVYGGTVLALLSLRAAGAVFLHSKGSFALSAIAAFAAFTNAVLLVAQWLRLQNSWNGFGAPVEASVLYAFLVVAYLAASAIVLVPLVRACSKNHIPKVSKLADYALIAHAGIFAARFGFYAMHMTVGLGPI